MSGKLKRWLRTGVMLALLSIACPVHAFYNPSAGRWLSRDPIAETGGVNSLGFVKRAHDRNLHGSGGEGEGVIAGGVKVGAGSPKVVPLAAPFDATQGQNIFRPGF